MALLVAVHAYAGSPSGQRGPFKNNNVLELYINQTASIAADAIDTTGIIDISRAVWQTDPATDLLYLHARIGVSDVASGESLQVTIDVSDDGTTWDATASLGATVFTGTVTNMVELVEWGRFIRMRILNQDDDAHDYDLKFTCPAK